MQRRQFIRLMFAGQLLWALTWFIFQGAAPTRVQAQPPRPTLTPAPSAIPRSRSDDDQDNEPLATGRITGTVIDLASGAPASGIRVAVSDVTIITDANGNYDRSGLPPGTYVVTLVLTEDQGTPAQGPVTIKLTPGATVVQHLAFRGITRASPTSSIPAIPTTHMPERPATLPATSGTDGMTWIVVLGGIGLIIGGVWMRRLDRQS